MTEKTSRLPWILTIALGLALALCLSMSYCTPEPVHIVLDERPECGHDAADSIPSELIVGTGHVPEFNDCQRFVLRTDTGFVYGGLFAIYASRTLEQVVDSLGLPLPDSVAEGVADSAWQANSGRQGSPPDRQRGELAPYHAVSAAALIAAAGAYEPLRIARGLNCLYVGRLAGEEWFARLVPNVPPDQSDCSAGALGEIYGAVVLEVKRDTTVEFRQPSDFPPVARWDWDRERSEQYIGIACGTGWCEVGRRGFTPSPLLSMEGAASVGSQRVRRIKGWYDQQLLAKGNSAATLRPSGVMGTVIPVEDLAQKSDQDFIDDDVEVAHVVLEDVGNDPKTLKDYQRKYNFHPASFRKPARILIRDARENGEPNDIWDAEVNRGWLSWPWPWWMDKKVKRRPVPDEFKAIGYKVPGVARWRWLQVDDGVWIRCSEGCCEMSIY